MIDLTKVVTKSKSMLKVKAGQFPNHAVLTTKASNEESKLRTIELNPKAMDLFTNTHMLGVPKYKVEIEAEGKISEDVVPVFTSSDGSKVKVANRTFTPNKINRTTGTVNSKAIWTMVVEAFDTDGAQDNHFEFVEVSNGVFRLIPFEEPILDEPEVEVTAFDINTEESVKFDSNLNIVGTEEQDV